MEVLASPGLFRAMTAYQPGIYADLREIAAAAAAMKVVQDPISAVFYFAPVPDYMSTLPYVVQHGRILLVNGGVLGLPCEALGLPPAKEARLPLHLAIILGDVVRVQRWLACRPALASTAMLDVAVFARQWGLIMYLHQDRHEGCSTNAMDRAAKDGYLDVVRFLHNERPEGCTVAAIDGAAENGHLEIVKFLAMQRREGHSPRALEAPYKDVVSYLIGRADLLTQ
ncbi:hypothetical protein ACHHYP_11076 [Achlya hypogyna]|uniref:Ankyrin repeat protein n=1 Tax=Achlya hypogyna TaxID=1202772 RepID=A0A1V9YJZ3_ACHHY|nr:hypothetical protein ACHHYP_11076 [Achlya hypogyna]